MRNRDSKIRKNSNERSVGRSGRPSVKAPRRIRGRSSNYISFKEWKQDPSNKVKVDIRERTVRQGEPQSRYRKLTEDPTPITLAHEPYTAFSDHPIIEKLYGIDKLEIVSKVDPDILKKKFDEVLLDTNLIRKKPQIHSIEELNEDKNNKRYKYDDAFNQGYRSLFRCVYPTEGFFDLLIRNEDIFGKNYFPWHLELFQDLVVNTVKDALILNDYLIQTSYRRQWADDSKANDGKKGTNKRSYVHVAKTDFYISEQIYQERLRSDVPIKEGKGGILSEKTLYLGNGDDRFVSYARYSKTAFPEVKKPCVHREWRFQLDKRPTIRKSLGIAKLKTSYLRTLKNLTGLKAAIFFNQFTKTNIKYAEIKKIALSKHYLGWTDRKNFTEGDAIKLNEYYRTLEKNRDIENTAKFINFCKDFGLDERRFLSRLSLMPKADRSLLRREINNINKREPKKTSKKNRVNK